MTPTAGIIRDPLLVLAGEFVKYSGYGLPDVMAVLKEDKGAIPAFLDSILPEKADEAQLVIFVDQFEELFTVVEPAFRLPFVNFLSSAMASEKVRVIVTMRIDILGQCTEAAEFDDRLAAWFNEGQFMLLAPNEDALREMIEMPAKMAGFSFEEGLVDRIVVNTGTKAGNLALMAFALEQLYNRRSGRMITWEAYNSFNGVEGAVANKAEEVFQAWLVDGQGEETVGQADALLSEVFSELVEIDEETGAPIRRRAALDMWDLAVGISGADAAVPAGRGTVPTARKLIQDFIGARLLVADDVDMAGPTLEVAHEAVFRSWPLLSKWIESRRYQFVLRKRLQRDAAEWHLRGEPEDGLHWPDATALEAGLMIRSLHYTPTDVESRFLGPIYYDEMQRLIHERDTPHQVRAVIGNRLAIRSSDERPGVGVRDGLPDLVWCPVPPGRVTLEEGAGIFEVADCLIAKYPVTQVQYQLFLDAPDGFANCIWWQELPEQFYENSGKTDVPSWQLPCGQCCLDRGDGILPLAHQ